MNYIQLSITAGETEQEIIISQLSLLGATGFEQTDTHLNAYFEEDSFNSYDINAVLQDYTFEIVTLQEQNWNTVWEHNFQPVVVDHFCAIRADFHEPIPDVQYEIIITPKMSFGTGHHATTHMMMQQMQHLDFYQKSVFDFGTGTGILAILAEKLGAATITAVDNDEWSFENARENAQNNNCHKIEIQLSSVLPKDEKFDIVLANINRNVILEYINHLKDLLQQGSKLLLSGLLIDDKEVIQQACHKVELQLEKETERNGWISLLFMNNG